MNLTTNYLGLELRAPLVPSASPLSDNLDSLKRLEDAGASAVVLPSMFEEQIRQEKHTPCPLPIRTGGGVDAFRSFFPGATAYRHQPDGYLSHLAKAKETLGIPIIASLNGSSFGGWTSYARSIQQAGADALELNIYSIPTDAGVSADEIELGYLTIVASVKAQLKIPVSLKLNPYFTNLSHFVQRLDQQGVDGLVLFNRFYQPDIDIETGEIVPSINLSTPGDLRLPLRWIAMLHGRLRASLAATSGIHSGADAVKLLMAGADVTMLCSVLLKKGVHQLGGIEQEISNWMESHGYSALAEFKGKLSQKNCPDPSSFERAQYMRAIAVDRLIVPTY